MASSSFAWVYFYNGVVDEVQTQQDIILCFTHFVLISNGFTCVGLGNFFQTTGFEIQMEMLPKGWSRKAIGYMDEGKLFNLRRVNTEEAVIINIIRAEEPSGSMASAVLQIPTKAVIQRKGSLKQMIPNSEELAQIIKKQLIDKIAVSSKYKDSTSQTTETNQGQSPRLPNSPSAPEIDPANPLRIPFPRDNLLSVGTSDLDPVGGFGPGGLGRTRPFVFPPMGGDGMLFVPPRAPSLPSRDLGVAPGSIPPGARFDPFRPPDVDRFNPPPHHPDNDDFPPPGFDDNMYI